MRNDPEKLLRRRLERAMRVSRVKTTMRVVHRWRGRRFVTAPRMVIAAFTGRGRLHVFGEPSVQFYPGDFGVR